ncbi:MAG: POTRA domain-containing protein, partial [Bacteroidota bacterium]
MPTLLPNPTPQLLSTPMHRSFLSHICLLLLLLLPATLLAQGEEPETLEPGEYIISGLEVEGTGYTNPRSIELLSGLQIGQQIAIPGDALSEALRALWDQELFSDIELIADKVQDNKLFLKIKVIERPRISKYTFRGIKKNQSEDLREEIRFIRGQRFTETKERTATRIIRNYFNEKGYLNVETNVITQADTNEKNAVVVVMDIDKGKKVKIDDIVIEGDQVLEAKKMKRQLKETKEKRFWRVWKRSKYIPALWAEDKTNLVAYMRSE